MLHLESIKQAQYFTVYVIHHLHNINASFLEVINATKDYTIIHFVLVFPGYDKKNQQSLVVL